jgi:HK97 family phage portal protein
MSAFEWLKSLIIPKAQNVVDSSQVRRGDGVWESFTYGDGNAPSERMAMQVTAVSACVTLISGAIASLPMHVYRRSLDGDLTRDMRSNLWWVLNEEFSPRWTASAGWAFLTASKLLHGDGFAEILRSRGEIVGLVPIHPYRVRVIVSPDGMRLVYEIQPDPTIDMPDQDHSRIRVLDQDDILHVPGFGFNGKRGLSALRNSLRSSGSVAINAQKFSENFLENMARPDFALQTDQNLTDEQFAKLQDGLDNRAGPLSAGKPMILEGGLKIQTLTMPLEEMQLLETRKFQVEEIARAFLVPPSLIGHTEKSTSFGTGIEALGAGFVRYTLRDHLNAFQNEINRKFFRTAARVAEFDTTELERGDTKAMFEAMRVGLGRAGEAPMLTIQEARQTLRLPREMPAGETVPEQMAPTLAPEPEQTETTDAPDD